MTQHLFAAETAPTLVNLDANFTALYDLRELFTTPGYGAATPKLSLDSSGNFYIATVVAGARLNVGYARATIHGAVIRPDADTGGGSAILFLNAAASTVGSISTTSTATVYATSSDYRLKSGATPITGSGAFIDALKPCTWTWISDGSAGSGFIAHELQSVSPTSVHGAKDAVDADGKPIYQVVEYGSPALIAMLVAELQAVRARLHTLDGH